MKTLRIIFLLLLALALWNCDSKTPLHPASFSFAELKVGQEWIYLKWLKRYDGPRALTGDTLIITVTAKEGNVITFTETMRGDALNPPSVVKMFKLQFEGLLAKKIGENDSEVFRFLGNHDNALLLTQIDSNQVSIDIEEPLFALREQTGKNFFIGHAQRAQLHLTSYEALNVYYDERPTYYDGFGHVALFSPQEGMIATIYFGGYSYVEHYGYELLKH